MSHPSQIITDAVAALNRADWDTFIKLCDPISVRRFKSDLVWQFSDRGYRQPVTAEDFMTETPGMPREVAEYNVAEFERDRDPGDRLRLEISTVSSIEELNDLDAHEVLLRWLQARMPYELGGFSVRNTIPADGTETLEATERFNEEIDARILWRPKHAVLGSVRDGPDFAHVVCRRIDENRDDEEDDADSYMTPRDEAELTRALGPLSGLQLGTCRRQTDGSWRLIADRNLFFLASMSIDDVESN